MKHCCRWLLLDQLLFVPKHVPLSEKMRLAWLVSIPLALLTSSEVLLCAHPKDVSLDMLEKCHQPMFRLRISELRLEDLKTVTFYFWTLQEDHTPDNVTLTYLLEPFSSLLHVWLCRHQLSYCHACRGQTRQFQLVPVRSPRLLDKVFVLIHPLNWKSPHHARKGKEPRRMPYWKDKGHVSTLIFQGKVWIITAGTIGDVANIAFQKKILGISV